MSRPALPRITVIRPPRRTVWWVLTVVLAVLATATVMRWDEARLASSALAQISGAGGPAMAGAKGIYAFSGQLTSKTYGLWMLDVDTGTVWCYELQKGASGQQQMKLIAARSWMFDRYLEEFNVASPTPGEVAALVRQQRLQAEKGTPAAAEVSAAVPGASATQSPAPAGVEKQE